MKHMPFIKYLFLIAVTSLIVGCGGFIKPDLEALYQLNEYPLKSRQQQLIQPPVVVIPGIVSSTLKNADGDEVWFGPWYRLMFHDYRELELDIDPVTLLPKPSTITAGTLPDKVLTFDFYGSLFKILERYGEYNLAEIGDTIDPYKRQYYKFAYDWRYDNVDAARQLDTFIDQIRADYGMPDLKVDLVAHSMGGLVARYYMRYGTKDVLDDNEFPVSLDGAKKVRRLIQLGAPNLGSVAALHQLIKGYKVFWGTMPVESVITMPSSYQLLPHAIKDWMITNEGKILERDLFDVEIWRRFKWAVFEPSVIERVIKSYENEEEGRQRVKLLQRYFHKHLERARRFVWSLTVPLPESSYSIIAFGGNCEPTPARLLVEEVDGKSEVRLWPHEIKNKIEGMDYNRIMLEPGDGRVTKPSMLARNSLDPVQARHKYSYFPLKYAFFLCHNHGQLTGNISFQDNLLNALLEN